MNRPLEEIVLFLRLIKRSVIKGTKIFSPSSYIIGDGKDTITMSLSNIPVIAENNFVIGNCNIDDVVSYLNELCSKIVLQCASAYLNDREKTMKFFPKEDVLDYLRINLELLQYNDFNSTIAPKLDVRYYSSLLVLEFIFPGNNLNVLDTLQKLLDENKISYMIVKKSISERNYFIV